MMAFLLPYLTRYGAYGAILAGVWISGCTFGVKRESARTEGVKADYLQFRQNVETAGKLAQQHADIVAARNAEKAKASDESYSKALSILGTDLERLRRARTSTDYLPPKPPDSVCPEGWACFDRTALESAIRQLDAGVSGIVEKSDAVRLRMDEAIRYVNRLNP